MFDKGWGCRGVVHREEERPQGRALQQQLRRAASLLLGGRVCCVACAPTASCSTRMSPFGGDPHHGLTLGVERVDLDGARCSSRRWRFPEILRFDAGRIQRVRAHPLRTQTRTGRRCPAQDGRGHRRLPSPWRPEPSKGSTARVVPRRRLRRRGRLGVARYPQDAGGDPLGERGGQGEGAERFGHRGQIERFGPQRSVEVA